MRFACSFFFAVIIALAFAPKVGAQTCTGSLGAPVIDETFGAGTTYGVGPELAPGVTNLQYVSDNCGGNDNTYTIASSMGSSCKGGTWQYIAHDHTGDPNGYMMIINAALSPSQFFTYNIDGSKLCPNTTYQFAAYIMNILRPLPQTQGYVEPNITFRIETKSGVLLQTYNTGDIPASDEPTWIQYGTFFKSPSDGSDLVVKMINNGMGGNGNDLALDDITVSPCGPLISTGFGTIGNITPKNNCAGDNVSYALVAQQTGYPDPVYQWQKNLSDGNGWVNIPGATSTSYALNIPGASAGTYQYRIGVLVRGASPNCTIYSAPLTVNVYPPPTINLPPVTAGCIGQEITLQASGGDSYLWTGPNNFSSTTDSPVLSYNATTALDGVYHLEIIKNNCPFFTSTTVKIYPGATVAPMPNVAICAGSSTQLQAVATNTTNYQWSPSTGLNHDDIANPVATPAATTTYTVSVSNAGCPDVQPQTSVTVTVYKDPVANAGAPLKFFQGQTGKLKGSALGDSIVVHWVPTDYLDDPSSLTPVTSAPGNITYTLYVESAVGCGISTSSVFVRVYKTIKPVNTFTPNGDGVNDLWAIQNTTDYPNITISVFNRYGYRVFESHGYTKPWDGTENDRKLPAGTYYYLIDPSDDDLPKLSGWVAIIR